MSKELVRFKYKKDIIENIEESWEYYGKEDKLRKVIEELKNVYKIASSAKNAPKSEYEVKAKAWDKYKSHMESHIAGEINEEEFVSDLKSDYFESGELDE